MIGICDDLRKSVLQAAIQGRLTQQLPEDGNAEDLYNEIQAEKQRLIKEGKIKKEKSLPEITEDYIPFDIPDNWKWVRLQNIVMKITDGTHHSPPNGSDGDYMYISAKNIKDSGISLENITYVTKSIHDEIYSRCNPESGDVLLIKDGATAGVVTVNNIKEPFSMLSSVALIKVDSSFVDAWYLAYSLRSDLLYSIVREIMKGTGIPRITLKQIYPLVLPLPPLAEQKRIVARVDELMSKIDEMEKTEKDITTLYDAFPGDIKTSLLQSAIQGKLTEQLESDGNAEDLYNEIQAEKQRLIKEGKIKKEKPLPEITEDDIPFDIPDNWKWIRLADVVEIRNGFTPSKTNPIFWSSKDIPWFTVIDKNKQGPFISSTGQYISNNAVGISSDRIVPKDSVLLCCTASIGEYAYTLIDLTTNQQWNGLTPKDIKLLYSKYLFYWVQTKKNDMLDSAGTTTFPFLSTKKLGLFVFPLPPLAEQKRIVEKLDQLLPLCNSMKEAIDA